MKSGKTVILGLAAVLCVAVGVAFLVHSSVGVKSAALAVSLVFGITVTYAWPVAGTTAPTATQARNRSSLTATFTMADSDTQVVITHNWGLSSAELASRFPFCSWNYVTPGTGPTLVSWSRATNSVTFTKNNAAGSGAVFEVTLERPHTIIR